METLNMLGKPCPIPVVEAGKALKSHNAVKLVVDNHIAIENLEKMANQKGYEYDWDKIKEDEYTATIRKMGTVEKETEEKPLLVKYNTDGEYAVLFGKNVMGSGEEELGKILMKGFIYSLSEAEIKPKSLIFLNSGAKLTQKASNVLEDLINLEKSGCRILTCGTCINFYKLDETPAVGEKVDMFAITSVLSQSANTITV